MKRINALAILALAALGATLSAQVTKPAQPGQAAKPAETAKPGQAKTYDNEQDYEKAYVDSYKSEGHVNAQPIEVEAPYVDPELLAEYDLPLDVKIEFTVDAKGKVRKPVVKTDTDFEIAQDVIEAIYQWRFKPAIHDGKPVSERLLVTMEFIDSDELPAPSPGAGKSKTKPAKNVKITPVTVAKN